MHINLNTLAGHCMAKAEIKKKHLVRDQSEEIRYHRP